ncbi:MAG: hypothetical protein ACI88H_000146 [Cocleimonas sp.]|jgi:hypothetical protein
MAHKKSFLDSKVCIVCEKPYAWRKKWQDCWDDVKYCSERCRRNKHTINKGCNDNA